MAAGKHSLLMKLMHLHSTPKTDISRGGGTPGDKAEKGQADFKALSTQALNTDSLTFAPGVWCGGYSWPLGARVQAELRSLKLWELAGGLGT